MTEYSSNTIAWLLEGPNWKMKLIAVNFASECIRKDEQIAELREALRESRRYVDGAYECAFPDRDENERVLEYIDSLLSATEP